jgi:Cu(I)/Ag(I) efflux system membrane fusion protein
VTVWIKRLAYACLALALGAGAWLGIQYARGTWPFAAAPSAHVHGGAQPPAPLQADDSAQSAHAGHAHATDTPSGYAAFTVDPKHMAGLQLTTAKVEQREFSRTLRTVGVVTLDETRSAHVHSKVRGWIERIRANYVGQKVGAGEILCQIYSQEVYAAEVELASLLARSPGATGSDPLVAAARQRLALWDVPRAEVERLEQTREAQRSFPLLAPRAGTIVAKAAIQGMYVEPSLELYTLSDLSRVWIQADVYELDIPRVRIGDVARLTLQGDDESFEGKVAFLAPTLDEATRTRKVRFELSNQRGRFIPGAFANVELNVLMGRGLAVPESAVIRTGTRAIVFVVHGDHNAHISPREVKLGPLVSDFYRIESGLQAGDRVATGAQFLLDSESRLRASSAPGGAHVH